MTVKTFEKKYLEIQEKSKELLTQMSPLLKELKKLSKKALKLEEKALKLEEKAAEDNGLYQKPDDSGYTATDGWSIEVLYRLGAFDCMDEAATNIDAVLYNIGKTPFGRKVD